MAVSYRCNDALDSWRERITAALAAGSSPVTAPTTAGLVLVLLQGFTITAVTRPRDLPPPEEVDAATAALVKALLP